MKPWCNVSTTSNQRLRLLLHHSKCLFLLNTLDSGLWIICFILIKKNEHRYDCYLKTYNVVLHDSNIFVKVYFQTIFNGTGCFSKLCHMSITRGQFVLSSKSQNGYVLFYWQPMLFQKPWVLSLAQTFQVKWNPRWSFRSCSAHCSAWFDTISSKPKNWIRI